MTEELLCRLIVQSIDYGELMLTPDEAATLHEWHQHAPHAAVITAGRLIELHTLPLIVMAAP